MKNASRHGSSTAHDLMKCSLLAAGLAVVCGESANAQSIDSLTAALSSASSAGRSIAVGRISTLPANAIPASTKAAIVALLDREATGTEPLDPSAHGAGDESWSEYIIDLTDLVLKVGDASALRGLARLGIQTSRDAQQFVAGFGSQALGPLAEAWGSKPNSRPYVVTTWALLATTADSATKLAALKGMLAPDDTFPIALAGAAEAGNLVTLTPLLDSLAMSPMYIPLVQRALKEAADKLRPRFLGLTADAVLGEYENWLGAICLNATGALQGYCESSENGIDNSTKHLLRGSVNDAKNGQLAQARQELQTIIVRTVNAVASGVLTSWQGTLLITGLRAASARIPA